MSRAQVPSRLRRELQKIARVSAAVFRGSRWATTRAGCLAIGV